MDRTGQRCLRLRGAAEVSRCRSRVALQPKIVLAAGGRAQEVWRNGMHRRVWLLLLDQARGDRRCFLMTLKQPPLIHPTLPF